MGDASGVTAPWALHPAPAVLPSCQDDDAACERNRIKRLQF